MIGTKKNPTLYLVEVARPPASPARTYQRSAGCFNRRAANTSETSNTPTAATSLTP
jgi:hypothetical protein